MRHATRTRHVIKMYKTFYLTTTTQKTTGDPGVDEKITLK
jgi:hypothetical protein